MSPDKNLMQTDNPFTPQYALSLLPEHRQPMQIPSNSVPPGENSNGDQSSDKNTGLSTDDPIDSESVKGIFGWETVDDTSIPYILRKTKKFVSVRIVERKLLSKYPNTFPDELGKKDPLVSYFITDAEAKLLNEINTAHCDYEYGHNPFTTKDLIVDLEEFEEFFKIVKKTFPADVLAKIGGELTPPAMTPPVKPELSNSCGWMQINNTVSPYILRQEGGKQVKLVPLSVIVYAAGLLTNSSVDGLLPTPQECALLNEACKAAGFDFNFGKNTRLISINEVIHRCQVQLFELPFKNPLQHARYLDPRTGQPSSNPLVSSQPVVTTSSVSQHSSARALPTHHTNMEFIPGSHPEMNPFFSIFQRPGFPPSTMTMNNALQNYNPAMLRPPFGMGIDPSRLPSQRSHMMSDKNIDNSSSMAQSMPGSPWPIMTRAPPPAHTNNLSNTLLRSKTPPISQEPPISSAYQQLSSLPSNHLQHSKYSPSMPDLNHPIYRVSPSMSQRPPSTQILQKDSPSHMVRYPPPITGLPPSPSQYSAPPFSFGVNQFDSSLFARTDIHEMRHARDTVGSNQPTSRRRSSESPQNAGPHLTNIVHQITNAARQSADQTLHLMSTSPGSYASNNNHQKADLSQMISACLVNGKSISCLNVKSAHRTGSYCLVEAVSKLYFPTVPLAEFVKVLQYVLKVNLYECTAEEEAAFVHYYNLPVSKLKCNKIIKVDDLENYFPQLNYMFSKCQPDKGHLSAKPTTHSAQKRHSTSPLSLHAHKRSTTSPLVGPPVNLISPKQENSSSNYGSQSVSSSNGGGTSRNGANEAPVIVIDD
ncbi:unnamed protein product [Lymnaea stagnalis]|uniref:Uncharacterized protein n=1 Tax=Lymnaea stagnalis TaxID=6523 RepID=A0AAV2GYD0_LYMST